MAELYSGVTPSAWTSQAAQLAAPGLEAEIMEAMDRMHHALQGRRQRGFGGIGIMRLAVHHINVDLGLKALSTCAAVPLTATALRARATLVTVKFWLCSHPAILAISSWLAPKRSAYSSGVSHLW